MYGQNQYKFWVKEVIFSKLPRINTTFVCRSQNNKMKWFMIYVYLPIQYSLTENNTTNLVLCMTGRCKQ